MRKNKLAFMARPRLGRAVWCGLALGLAALGAQAGVVYSNLPSVLPPNLTSLGYQATSTSQFGDHISFAAGGRTLEKVTVAMSDWALASTYGSSAAGYNHNLTFNIYNYAGTAAAGSIIATQTINAFIPWRPEADPTCPGGTAWRASNGSCYNGLAFNVEFDFTGLGVVLPDEIVFGLAFNTQSYGDNPTGVNGPYNSLNFALAGAPSVGTDMNPDGVFWNTSQQSFLTTGTAGTFGQDTDWGNLVPAVQFQTADATVPEPSTLALVGLAMLGLVRASRRTAR